MSVRGVGMDDGEHLMRSREREIRADWDREHLQTPREREIQADWDREHLLTPREREIQADWDREHQLRVKDLHHRAQSALDRRMHVRKKFSELNDRWQGLESRLRTRENQYLQRVLHLDRQMTLP